MKLLYFGPVKDLAGRSEEVHNFDNPTLESVLSWLVATYPELESLIQSCAISVNLEYVDPSASLTNDDEVAIIPPISAG